MPTFRRPRPLALAWLTLALATAARAAVYDDFSASTGLDRTKWLDQAALRVIDNGQLRLGRQTVGGRTLDSGLLSEDTRLTLQGSTVRRGLKATLTIDRADLSETCSGNPAPAMVWAMISGSFFNVRAGGATTGRRSGDLQAQVRVVRSTRSSDPGGTFRVEGLLTVCQNADCSLHYALGPSADLGLLLPGSPTTVQLEWLPASDGFVFTRDASWPQWLGYSVPDHRPPALTLNTLSVRVDAPNCRSSAAVRAGIEALFDNVGVLP